MTTIIQPLPKPPVPSDTPAEFNSKAFSFLGALSAFVDEANQLAGEVHQNAQNSGDDADLARQYSESADSSASSAGTSAASATDSKASAALSASAASAAKQAAEQASAAAAGYATGMEQAIAAARQFASVPQQFESAVILVTQPHPRSMIWSTTQQKYVRAPWHSPGGLKHFLRDVPLGHIEVRSDVVLNTADFPDLAEYLGVTGSTFVLDETRGEFLRALDSGRGIDSGRAVGSWQGSDNKSHTHTGSAASDGYHTHSVSGTAASAGAHTHAVGGNNTTSGGQSAPWKSSLVQNPYNLTTVGTEAGGAHTHSVSGTANSAGSHTHTVSINADGGSEARPRNVAYRLAVQY